MKVSSKLDKLALWYDYTIVCDDIKSKVINKRYDKEFDTTIAQWGVELTNPIEYTRAELLQKYDGKTRIYRWVHTYTEDGKPAMAIVIEK